MDDGAIAGRRLTVTETSRVMLPRHVRMRYDEARGRWVILVPERVLVPDETSVEIIQMCDGKRTVGEIVDDLARKYAADRGQITADVIAMFQDLADKGFLETVRDGP
jgi:pyrroloquinoline quinone biosynthesis protein D